MNCVTSTSSSHRLCPSSRATRTTHHPRSQRAFSKSHSRCSSSSDPICFRLPASAPRCVCWQQEGSDSKNGIASIQSNPIQFSPHQRDLAFNTSLFLNDTPIPPDTRPTTPLSYQSGASYIRIPIFPTPFSWRGASESWRPTILLLAPSAATTGASHSGSQGGAAQRAPKLRFQVRLMMGCGAVAR